ncbi:MAG: hypothetical protein LM580_05315, partial [Thermofilum sp.]|nr:hypothetical protein [Thermofilum sp.]
FDEEGILLRNVLAREEARYVPHPCEEKLREAFEKVRGGGVVVVRGGKGEGKSSLAKAFLAKLMAREPTAVIDILDIGESARDVGALKNVIDRVRDANRNPVLFYDPSKAEQYPTSSLWSAKRSQYKPQKGALAEATAVISDLVTLVVEKRVPAIVVLSDDLYKLVKEQLQKVEAVEVEVSLENEGGFLEELVEAYSAAEGGTHCGKDTVREVARAVTTFEDNRAVAAVLAADWLKRRCEPEAVVEALQKARKKVEDFVIDYIWRAVLKEDRALANTLAPLLILAGIYGPIPRKLGEELLIALGADQNVVRGNEAIKWLSQPLHITIWTALHNFISIVIISSKEVEAHGSLAEAVREALRVLNIGSLISEVCNILEDKLRELQPSCWRRLALIAGSALVGHSLAPLEAALRPEILPRETLEPCEIDDYLLIEDRIPPLILKIMLYRPGALTHPFVSWRREAASELKRLEEDWRKRGSAYLIEMLYALGLALIVAEASRLGEEVEDWEVEAALFAAAIAVQRVFTIESVAAVLEMFKLLSKLAPHYHVMLASAPSALPTLNEKAVREIASILDETLQNHREELEEKAWLLVYAVDAYSNLLTKHAEYFSTEELELMRKRMCELLGKLNGHLRVIAEAFALQVALERGSEPCNGTNLVSKAMELFGELEKMEGKGLDDESVEWAKMQVSNPENYKLAVKDVRGLLTMALAWYMMLNDNLEAAERLFESAAAIYEELRNWGNYLAARSLAARCSVLRAKSLDELRERARIFESLWSEAKKHETAIALYLEYEALTLMEYLVFLTLEGRMDEVSKLLDEKRWLLKRFPDKDEVIRVLLEYLGVSVEKPETQEIMQKYEIAHIFQLVSNPLTGSPGSTPDRRGEIKDEKNTLTNSLKILKSTFLEFLDKIMEEQLGRLAQGAEEREVIGRFHRELQEFVKKQDIGVVVLPWALIGSLAGFVLMPLALSNGDEELARAIAKLETMLLKEKLLCRLFREAAEARSEEELKLALLKLFYYHF